jgi:hypothetical protein
MWDRWVAEKIEECVGRFTLLSGISDKRLLSRFTLLEH